MNKKFFVTSDNISVKSASKDKVFKIAGYANTSDKDRTGDVVLSSAWAKGVEDFRRNPILLYQHDHSKPIGKVNNISVDKKGIFVEAQVSEAAEKLYGVQSLINDGALKSFSVGFKIKDADYDRTSDSFMIKDVELLEISVVSVPANQYSLFSVRKSFEDSDEYESFKKTFVAESDDLEEKQSALVEEDNEEKDEAIVNSDDPYKPIPFINLLNEDTADITLKSFVQFDGARYKTNKIATADSPTFIFEKCDAAGYGQGYTTQVAATDITVLNHWDLGKNFDIHLLITDEKSFSDEEKVAILSNYKQLVTAKEFDLFTLKSNSEVEESNKLQRLLNDSLNLASLNYTQWNDSHYYLANKSCKMITALKNLPQGGQRDIMLKSLGHSTHSTLEEKTKMTTENVGDPIVINSGTETKSATQNKVSEPRVSELVEKTGEAIIKAEDAKMKSEDTGAPVDSRVMEELAELRGQLKAYREQVSAAQSSKMHYQEQQRTTQQFSEKDMTNAVFLAKAMGKRDLFDTPLGSRMKAVLTDTNLNEAFSTNVYHEMQQQLVVAPMFNRIEVNSRSFRVPVADEDTSDFVAQFPSGSFAAGVSDTTTVPTSRQAQIGAVELAPKKFMVATHIAKDEEEDTIIPLVDFLRQAATRRLARGMDKALLRGDGSLSAFSASNTLTGAGAYASVIKGVIELAAAQSGLVTATGTTIDKANPSDIATARMALGKYGLALGENLAYITSVEGYNHLVSNTDFQTVDKFGSQATYLTGSVGAIYGIPIFISEFMDNATAANANLGVLVYKPGFLIGERRAMEIESEYLPQQQVTAMYLSTRMDFKALTTESSAALSTRYSYASLITTAGS